MNVENALISKIISTGQYQEVVSKGIRPDLFADDDARDMFIYIQDYARQYRSAPSEAAVRNDHPEFEWEFIQDTLQYLIDRFVILAKRRLANDMLVELANLTKDPKESEKIDLHFLEVSRKLATLVPSTEVHRFVGDMNQRIEEYEKRAKEGKLPGVPFGFGKLDKWTGGLQPHEFATCAGFSGLGKSTFLMKVAFNAWASGRSVLYISLEMEARTIARKFDAMAADLNYNQIKQLDLPPEAIIKWRQTRDELLKSTHEIPIMSKIRGCTPDHVFAETVRHQPDLVVIDYISLMRSSRPQSRGVTMWQSLTEITQELKQNARTLEIPILAAAQTNRAGGKDGAELDNVGYALSIVQDSDIFIGLYADEEMRERKRMEIRLNKNRDGKLGKFEAIWNHEDLEFRDADDTDRFIRNHKRPEAEDGTPSYMLNGDGMPRQNPFITRG